MKKLLLATVATLLFSAQANAGVFAGSLPDSGADELNWLGFSPNNDLDEAASTVAVKFVLKGQVSKVCVIGGVDLPGGGNNGTATVDFGTIGIQAGDDLPVNQQFLMNGPAVVAIGTPAAGCNYKNSVTLTKQNGADGMVNASAAGSGYDTSEFTDNLPYRVEASFAAAAVGSVSNPTFGSRIIVLPTAAGGTANYGAWRSPLALLINVPAPALGLVGGAYEDTLTLELKIL